MEHSPFAADGRDGAPPARRPTRTDAGKVARTSLARLLIETEHCRHVLPHIFETLRTRDILTLGIEVERGIHVQAIAIETAALPDNAATILLQDLRRLRNVRAAGFATAAARQPSAGLFFGRG